jgi:excisionase family DNA binding protein
MNPVETYYTPREVADILKLTVQAIYDYIADGKLRAARLGRRYRISPRDLQEFMDRAYQDVQATKKRKQEKRRS